MKFEITKKDKCFLLEEYSSYNAIYTILMDGDYVRYKLPRPNEDLEEIVSKIEDSRMFQVIFNDILDNFQSVMFTLNYGNTFEFEVNI